MTTRPKFSKEEQSEILSRIQKKIYNWYTYFSPNYVQGRIDKFFLRGQQWDSQDLADLQRLQLPTLTFNKLYNFTKNICGEQRQNTPNLQIRPKNTLDDTSTQRNKEIQRNVELRADIVRDIAYTSKSSRVYQAAFQDAIEMGYGAFCVNVDYEGAKSFNLIPRIETIKVAEQAFFDPVASSPSKTDGNYCGKYVVMDLENFKKTYPWAKDPSSYPDQTIINYFDWGDKDSITVVDYYEKEWFDFTLYELENGLACTEEELDELYEKYKKVGLPMPEIVNERDSSDYKIMHYRCSFNEILECTEFPSKTLPVFFVDGDSWYQDGQQRTTSFIRHAVDAQRFLNYTGVAIAQSIKSARKEKYIASPDNIAGFEDMWRNPERTQGVLMANPDRKTGGMPEYQPPSEIPQSLLMHFQRATQDIQGILGFYAANLGAPNNAPSGVAQDDQIRQGNASVYVYQDNLIRSVEDCGRCILEMLPIIMDKDRIVTATKHDGTSKNVRINQMMPDGSIKNDMTEGEYDICVEAGPGFLKQQEDERQLLMQLAQLDPAYVPALGDLIAANINVENKAQVVNRVKTFVPPNIIAMEEGKPMPPPPNPMQNPAIMLQMQEQKLKATDQQIEMQNLQLKAKDQMMQQQQNQLDALKMQLEYQQEMTKTQQDKLQNVAEMYKANVDYKGSVVNALAKIHDGKMKAHISNQKASL